MKKEDSLVHIRLEYDNAVDSKKELLSTEIGLIKIAQSIRKYKLFRDREFDLKESVLKQIKDTKLTMRKLKVALPELKIPKILQEKKQKEEKQIKEAAPSPKPIVKEIIKKKEKSENSLEDQLKEIQARLNQLR
jgi:uncharacterized protein YkwD